jgi:predicted ATPase
MSITKVSVKNFTAFETLDLEFSAGMNVFIGANGTGKTHLMKLIYSACDVSKPNMDFAEKLIRTFLPSGNALRRLVHRQKKSNTCDIQIIRDKLLINAKFTSHSETPKDAIIKGEREWSNHPVESVFIPAKEMLSNAPGFRSLYSKREIHFEEIYLDIIDRAYLPFLRGPMESTRKKLLENLQKTMDGKVAIKDQEFFLKNKQGNLEFTLLAEGIRKLGLLWLLIQNGTLLKGSVLFWDEPEANLNPKLYGPLVQILIELQRLGVQIFLATHDYVILKEIDLLTLPGDDILFHSLFRKNKTSLIECQSTANYLQIHPNAIQDTFIDLWDRDVERDLK